MTVHPRGAESDNGVVVQILEEVNFGVETL